jgi:hypothetical protein
MRMLYSRRKAEIEIIVTMPRISELGESSGNFTYVVPEERSLKSAGPAGQFDRSPFFVYLEQRIARVCTRARLDQ